MAQQNLPVAIIGAGPVGLAAAAHLYERDQAFVIFEAGEQVGANVRDWAHVRMFSPWEYTVDAASVRLLEASGWQMPNKDALPTGGDLYDQYMKPFSELPEISANLQTGARVVAISRRNVDKMKDATRNDMPFVLHVEYSNGDENFIEASAVIDATGTWDTPNPIGSGGLPAIGEKRLQQHIRYGIPDVKNREKARFANKRVMVVGNGHSAINALLDLATLQNDYPNTQIYWAMRSDNMHTVYGGQDDDQLPARGALGKRIKAMVDAKQVEIIAPFKIRELTKADNGITVCGETPNGILAVEVDEIIATTGSRPNINMLRELRIDLDSSLESTRALAPLIDPNIHSCGTVRPHGEAELRQPEKDFYIVGMKSYGRAPTFLLATGYEQVRSVVAGLVGDWDAARDVQLNLPETGVCSTDLEGDSCCGTPATADVPVSINLNDIGIGQPIALQPVQETKSGGCC